MGLHGKYIFTGAMPPFAQFARSFLLQALISPASTPAASALARDQVSPPPIAPHSAAAATPANPATVVDNDRALSAVRYRLTRKRLVARQLGRVLLLRKELDRLALELAGLGIELARVSGLSHAPRAPQVEAFEPELRAAVDAMRTALKSRDKGPPPLPPPLP